MSTQTASTENMIRALATQAGIYREAGDLDMVADAKRRATELMRGCESGAIRNDCRIAWARGFDTGRRAYHGIGKGETIPATELPYNPSPKMQRAIQNAEDLDRFYATQSAA